MVPTFFNWAPTNFFFCHLSVNGPHIFPRDQLQVALIKPAAVREVKILSGSYSRSHDPRGRPWYSYLRRVLEVGGPLVVQATWVGRVSKCRCPASGAERSDAIYGPLLFYFILFFYLLLYRYVFFYFFNLYLFLSLFTDSYPVSVFSFFI